MLNSRLTCDLCPCYDGKHCRGELLKKELSPQFKACLPGKILMMEAAAEALESLPQYVARAHSLQNGEIDPETVTEERLVMMQYLFLPAGVITEGLEDP